MKIFRLVVAVIFLGALAVSSTASAVDENYFNGDKNYVSCGWAGMGTTVFIDRNTLNVEKYAPPIYIISVETFSVSHYGEETMKIGWRTNRRFKYDYANRKMYTYAPDSVQFYKGRYERDCKDRKIQPDTTIDWSGDWAYIDPHVYYGEGAIPTKIGEMVFALAYKLKFYGYEGKYYDARSKSYKGDFYEAVRGVVGEVKDGV